jgi:hypothetical protein
MDEDDDAADQESIFADQQSLCTVSTFDLPSPALSSQGTEKKIEKKIDKGSWVWKWAEKRTDEVGNVRVHCLVNRCPQKKGWAMIGSSTSNIRNHLVKDHKLNSQSAKDGSSRTGSIENAIANQGKRSSAHFSKDELERQVCKILVRHKLPYTFVQSPLLQELLDLAHSAPNAEDLKLPSNDTITRRVC